MNLFGEVFLAVMALLFVFTIGSLAFNIVRNLREGLNFRRTLAARIEKLRLHKMLARLGIDPGAYLHTVRVAEVEKQMATCQACPTQSTCDEELATNPTDSSDYSFCPNQESLKRASPAAQAGAAG
jgi:Family of unknown function (DUF6455)